MLLKMKFLKEILILLQNTLQNLMDANLLEYPPTSLVAVTLQSVQVWDFFWESVVCNSSEREMDTNNQHYMHSICFVAFHCNIISVGS